MVIHADGIRHEELKEELLPVRIMGQHQVEKADQLFVSKGAAISFRTDQCAICKGKGSWLLLDFGKELCGGIRIITRGGGAQWRLTFGESVTEACSAIGEKNATNDHSPRDFTAVTRHMSDLTFGQTGFRFVRVELLEEATVFIQNIFAVNTLPWFDREASIVTNDPLVNDILSTAAYTLKLNFQNGYVWDGIKRDRLVWCGDLHPEIMTSLYLLGATPNIPNSLDFLRESTPSDKWVNEIPSYSAWWVFNLCDYCKYTGDMEYFRANRDYACAVLAHINGSIADDGTMNLTDGAGMEYFLDWSTHQTPDAPSGVAAMLRLTAQKYLAVEDNADARDIERKLAKYLTDKTVLKPVRAFQVLAGRADPEDAAMLQRDGAAQMSTFMAYYILTATAKAGGTDMLEMMKEYYGGMLSRGATSFWEDFDIEWLKDSGRIDEFPTEGQKDIHGDFGKYCYQQFRHLLCHGWSSGVYAFFVEHVLGVHIEDGGKKVTVEPHLLGLTDIEATLPMPNGDLTISIHGGERNIVYPTDTVLIEK